MNSGRVGKYTTGRLKLRTGCVLLSVMTAVGLVYASLELSYDQYRIRRPPSAAIRREGQSSMHAGHNNVPRASSKERACTVADVETRPGKMVLTTTNAAFIDFTDNWLESIRRTQVCPNLTIVAEDERTLQYYTEKPADYPGLHVVKSRFLGKNSSDLLAFASKAYNKFVNRRQRYFLPLLQNGYEVLFTDVDTFWLRDPFPYFTGDFDLAVERDLPNFYCAGFVYFRPTKNTIAFVTEWIKFMETDTTLKPDQEVMNYLIKQKKIPGLKVRLLDSDNFPNGKLFFDKKWRENKKEIVVVHNNWIIGHDVKVERFKSCGMWVAGGKTNSTSLCVEAQPYLERVP